MATTDESLDKIEKFELEEEKTPLKTKDNDNSAESEDTTPPKSPDGGYGWIVVLSAFFTFFISDGFAYSFGVLYAKLLEKFKESRSTTAWIPSLFYGLPLICGPISGALATRFGCRITQIAGGIVASIGVFASAFATSIPLLYFTLGIVSGTGMSMGYVTSLVTVAFYFEKKRALATGIAVSGSGFGTFALAPLFEYLIDEYDWQGTMIILSGLTLNLVVCGALLRPVTQLIAHDTNEDDVTLMEKDKKTLLEEIDEKKEMTTNEKRLSSIRDTEEILPGVHKHDVSRRSYTDSDKRKRSVHFARNSLELEKRPKRQRSKLFKRTSFQDKKLERGHRTAKSLPVRRQFSSMRKLKQTNSLPLMPQRYSLQEAPLYRTDIFYRGNLSKIRNAKDRPKSVKGIQFGSIKEPPKPALERQESTSLPEVFRLSTRVRLILEMMFDREVLKNRLFLFFLVSNFILYFWYDVPYVYIVDHAEQNGVDAQSATFLLSIIGILTTIGQIFFGFLGDKDLNMSILYGIPLMMAGISVFVIPMVTTYASLCVSAAAFGLFISVDYALDTCLMVEFVGMDKLTSAYGISMMCQGIANLIGPPVAGVSYDVSGDYRVTFFSCGGCIILSGFLVAFIPILRLIKRHKRRKTRKFKRNAKTIETIN